MSTDPYDLQRFVDAQAADGIYERALDELRAGEKRSHWMWFVFPQLKGLGHSSMAERYGITGRDEAQAYLAHPQLGPRLIDCAEALLQHRAVPAEQVLGSTDAMKLRSSMTLFEAVAPDPTPFAAALDDFHGGRRDRTTLERLRP
jgi:uncharacterized protein (DUF1810 family)